MAVEARYTITKENQQDTVPTYQLVSEYNARSFLAKPMFAAGVARDNEALLLRKKNQVRDVQLALLDRSIGNTTRLVLPEPVYVLEEDSQRVTRRTSSSAPAATRSATCPRTATSIRAVTGCPLALSPTTPRR